MKLYVSVIVASVLGLGACSETPDLAPSLTPLPTSPAAVVIASDYLSSAVTLLDRQTEVMASRWIHSGSAAPGLSTALSGDVVLPTDTPPAGELVLIDRLGVDLITRIAIPEGLVLGQHPTTLNIPGEAAFRSNPHDALYLDRSRILVSRFEPNLAPSTALNAGNDIVEIDLETNTPTQRVSFSDLDQILEGERIYARPSRMTRRGDTLLVGLGRLSLDFRTTGDGAVAFVPASLDAPPSALALPNAAGCSHVAPDPDAEQRAFVTCLGPSFVGEATRRTKAAIFIIDTETETIVQSYRPPTESDRPAIGSGALPIGADAVVAVGRTVEGMESAYLIDLSTGEQTTLLQAEGPYTLGRPSFAADLILIPDASRRVIARFRLNTAATFIREPDLQLGANQTLPPREIQHLPI